MIVLALAVLGLVPSALPAVIFLRNRSEFLPLPPASPNPPPVSVLIPARDEEASIAAALESVLQNRGVEFEVIVLDDHSTDRTAAIVREYAERDPRVRLISGEPLPAGWCGKQYACHQLSRSAKQILLMWIDADVRLSSDALARISSVMVENNPALLSGFPHQRVETFLEKLLIPLMHFILLGYCPLWLMRRSRSPAFGAGCGQLFAAHRSAYERAGGHAAIRASLHDGITLPRAFRRAGLATDIFDATDIAECRMYHSAAQVWTGLLKNAGEGLATPPAIVPWTLILGVGQILPVLLAIFCVVRFAPMPLAISLLAIFLSVLARFIAATNFRQPPLIALLHPLSITLLLAIQWQSVLLRMLRRPTRWRGRAYGTIIPE
jgi:hypothetical protein